MVCRSIVLEIPDSTLNFSAASLKPSVIIIGVMLIVKDGFDGYDTYPIIILGLHQCAKIEGNFG